MSLLSHFSKLFQYQGWANKKFLKLISEHQDPKSLEILSHNLGAELIWLQRIGKVQLSDRASQVLESAKLIMNGGSLTIDDISFSVHDLDMTWNLLIQTITEESLSEMIHYKNLKGDSLSTKLSDILMHVVNHATYHRGQISMNLKAKGLKTIPNDFIVFAREA
ncbi:MAG: DinB family protein [Chloroherpetonaceae bacterium]|nr:DinB family protein [Chloroherpetonaceae bacterium]